MESTDMFGGGGRKPDIVELKLLNDYVAVPRGLDKGINLELVAKQFKKKGNKGVVMMYDPKCPHCGLMKNPFMEMAKKMGDDLFVGAVNCMDLLHNNELLADYYKVNAVPTIKFFNGNDVYYDYTGGPVANELMAWVLKMNDMCKKIPKTSVYIDVNKVGGRRRKRSKSRKARK